jgi:GNAT superfamily N-acetyltransferase
MTVAFFIRTATAADAATVMHFIRELAVYEKLEHMVVNTEERIQQSVFGPDSNVRVVLVCEGTPTHEQPVGFALYFYNYSTFLGQKGIYLEDLFVPSEHRGKGYGKALMVRIAQIAVAENCGRFEWSVLDWNEPSIQFYRSIGAVGMDEWTVQRVTGDALLALANAIN